MDREWMRQKEAEIAEEERRQKTAAAATMDIQRINFLVSYVRSRAGFEGLGGDQDTYRRQIAEYAKKIADNIESPRTTAGGKK